MRSQSDSRFRPGYRRFQPFAAIAAGLIISVSTVGLEAGGLIGPSLAAASAAGQISPWTPIEAPLPPNAAADPLASLGTVACPADGSCVATGNYTDTSGNQQGLIETLSDGKWTATEAPLPANAGADPLVALGTVACPADGSCVATGSYTDTSGNEFGLIDTLSADTWSALEAPLPANADGNPRSSIGIAACPADGSCVATGEYRDTNGYYQSAIETLSADTWTSIEAPLPSDEATNPNSSIGPAACPADGSCVAMVEYADTDGDVESAIETQSGETWTVMQAPLTIPEAAQGHQRNLVGPVTCPAPGSCVAVGSYLPVDGTFQGLIETLSDGAWTSADAPLPSNAPTTNAYSSLDAVTCPATGDCVALGWYYDTTGKYHVVMESLSAQSWTATEQPLPARPAAKNPTEPGQGIGSVTCQSTQTCFEVGSYVAKNHKDKSIIETLAAGTWNSIKAPLPTSVLGTSESDLRDATCTSDGSCVAVGNSGGDPLIETLPGGESAPALSSADQTTFTVGQAATFTITATGVPAPSITRKGKLPKGLRFTAGTGTATISGTPTGAAGIFHITIEAQNGVAPTASQFFTLTVDAA